MINIKRLSSLDITAHQEKIEVLLKHSYALNLPEQKLDKQYFKEKLKDLLNYVKADKAIVYAAIEHDLYGFVWLIEYSFVMEKRIHINEIVVDPDLKNTGIGSKLLKKAFEEAKDRGIKVVDLNVNGNNRDLIRFYQNSGFEIKRHQMCLTLYEVDSTE